jgi:hypothetical protein
MVVSEKLEGGRVVRANFFDSLAGVFSSDVKRWHLAVRRSMLAGLALLALFALTFSAHTQGNNPAYISFQSALSSSGQNWCIDVPGGKFQPGTNVTLSTCTGQPNQTFNTEGGTLTAGGLCLDAQGEGNQSAVTMSECNGQNSQAWQIQEFQNGQQYQAIANGESMCITVGYGEAKEGAPLTLEYCQQHDAQGWVRGPSSAPQAMAGQPTPRVVYNKTYPEPTYYWRNGRRYCWYENGWNGAGWYVCGEASTRGSGYGGPIWWNNWWAPGQRFVGGGGGGGRGTFGATRGTGGTRGTAGTTTTTTTSGNTIIATKGNTQNTANTSGNTKGNTTIGNTKGNTTKGNITTKSNTQANTFANTTTKGNAQGNTQGNTFTTKGNAQGKTPEPSKPMLEAIQKMIQAKKDAAKKQQQMQNTQGTVANVQGKKQTNANTNGNAQTLPATKGFQQQKNLQTKPNTQGFQQQKNLQQQVQKKFQQQGQKKFQQQGQKKFQQQGGMRGMANQGGMGGMSSFQGGMSGGMSNRSNVQRSQGRSGQRQNTNRRPQQSDIQFKHDVVRIGTVADGIGLYRFRYNWSDQVYVGVMAQEVAAVRPDAVIRGDDGYLRVYYDRIGAPFDTWQHWQAIGGQGSGR